MKEVDEVNNAGGGMRRREVIEVAANDPMMLEALTDAQVEAREAADPVPGRREAVAAVVDADANAGSDYDAMSEEEGGEVVPLPEVGRLSIPNSVFRPARILVNPRCPTTYAGVSHTQLALDLFGDGDEADNSGTGAGKYVLDDWEGAPESFVCQEQRYTFFR